MTAHRLPVDVPVEPKLTPRQQAAWDLVRSTPGGVHAATVGANWHALTNRFDPAYQREDGLSVLRSKALRPLVIRRKATGKWEPRNPNDRANRPSVQTSELAGDTWEDLFGGEAA